MDATECARIEVMIAAHLDGSLAQSDELDRHLAACEPCRSLVGSEPVLPLFPLVDDDAYDLGRVIGQGGMGQIRLARDRRIGRVVAMKELLYGTPTLAARFVREARVAANLQHPNIIPVYEVGCFPSGKPFYTMRLVQGRTLHRAFAEADTYEDRMELLPALIAAVDATAFAHARGVVHRDLTPANILLGDFGETVVIDWGLAKDLRVDVERVAPQYQTGLTQKILTARGDVIGSPAYMPLEQAKGDVTDARADVYALGAILYHLVTGAPPYAPGSQRVVLEQVRAAPPPPVESHMKRAPDALVAIITRAMSRDPAGRHATAHELAADLRRYQADLFAGAHRSARRWWHLGS